MNCKKGDLAVVQWTRAAPEHHGKIVRCVWSHDGWWEVSPELPMAGRPGVVWSMVHDSVLRPIRNHGDDAQDETLAWKPVPLPAIQPELLERA